MQDVISSDSERSRLDSGVQTLSNDNEVLEDNPEAVAPPTPTATRDSSAKLSLNNIDPPSLITVPDETSLSTPQLDLATYPIWSVVLKTPTADELFSPTRDIQKSSSLHGLALQLTAARSQKLSHCGQKCAALLFELSNYHDTFATELQKYCQVFIQSGSPINQSPVGGLAHATHKSLVSFAKQVQGLAICIKGSVARPWKGYMITVGELAPNIYQGYASARKKASQARQAVLTARAKCVTSSQEAETAIQEFLDFKMSQTLSDDLKAKEPMSNRSESKIDDWETSLKDFGLKYNVVALTDRVVNRVKEVLSFEAQYKELVDKEKQAIEYVQTMEVMALEALSKLEEERIQNFTETVSRTLQAEKGALDKMILSLQEDKVESSLVSPDRRKKQQQQQDFFASLLTQRPSGQYEEGMGVMDADTLGLPQEVGKLRDEVRSRLEARSSRMQAMRTLASFFEEVASAAAGLSTAILNRLAQDGYPIKGTSNDSKQTGYLARDIQANEGLNALQIWNNLMGSFEQEAEMLSTLAKTLRSTRHEKLDIFLVRADKELKAASEHDDNMWKHLCEAARTETKAEQRYRQTAAMTMKARDRIKSVDSANSDQGTMSGNFKQSMSKALGNMFSVLPDGGDQAMQIFAPDARRAVAQSNLEEADQKEAKSREYLQAATQSKAKALASYKAKAEGLVASYTKDDQTGWSEVRVALESVVVEFEKLRTSRYDSLARLFPAVQQKGSDHLKSDMKAWTERVKLRVDSKRDQANQNPSEAEGDYATDAPANKSNLSVTLERSKVLENFLASFALAGSELKDDSLDPPNNSKNERREGGVMDSEETSTIAPTPTDLSAELPEPRNLTRSFTAPVAADDVEIDPVLSKLSSLDEGDVSSDDQNRMNRISSFGSVIPLQRNTNPESDVFLAHFWTDRVGNETPPSVIESFSCAYWPKEGEGYLSPLLHGRLFATAEAMYFVGWGGKKIELKWKDVVTVEKAKNLMGTIDNALRVTFETKESKGAYFFGSFSFRENAFTLMDRLSTVAKSLKEIEQPLESVSPSLDETVLPTLEPVPPDEALKRMEVVLSSTIENISIKRFYEIIWSEGIRTGARPFYKPWLCLAAHNVHVGDWEFAENGAPAFVNKWCGESYGQKRVIKFKFQRKTHLYIGPPVADVIQTHHCRLEGNDKVVLAMTVEFEGIPYADTFAVEVRWVARREGVNNVKVDVGLFVDFRKSTFLKKQISAGTIAETKPVHQSLFEAARRACAAAAEGVTEELQEEKKEEIEELELVPPAKVEKHALFDTETLRGLGAVVVAFLLVRWLVTVFSRSSTNQLARDDVIRLYERIDDLEAELKEIRDAMEQVLQVLKNRDNE